MTPEARLFAMTAILVFAGVACFGLAHFAVWRQRQLQEAAEREANRPAAERDPAPPQVSSISVKTAPLTEADKQTDGQTDPSVSALFAAVERLQLDKTREAIIDTLVAAGLGVGEIRAQLKGDNNKISAEVAEARKRLNMAPESREVVVRTHEHGERIEHTIRL